MSNRLMALVSEVCSSCGLQLRYFSRKYSSSQLADYYETGLCARCSDPKEGDMEKREMFGLYEIRGNKLLLIHWHPDWNYLAETYLGFSDFPMVILSNKHFEGRL